MKGDLKTDSPIRIVLFVALILCAVLLVFSAILPARGNISEMQHMTELCRDWERNSCSYGSAFSLTIPAEGGTTPSLAVLCAKHYSSTSFDEPTWKKCKDFCMCPKTTTV
jgi:hypothetical protein